MPAAFEETGIGLTGAGHGVCRPRGELELAGVKSISPEVAQILVRHKRLNLTGLTNVSPEVLAILQKNRGIQLPRPKNP